MLRILESPPQLVEHCSTPKHTAATTVEMNVFDIADISKRLTFLITKDHFDDEETWTKSVWALRRAFGDAGWPLAEKISYADDKNRLAGVWKRDDANKASPSTCASLVKLSNDLGYREWARERMFDGVAQLAASLAPGATNGGMPMMAGTQAIVELGAPIVEGFNAAQTGSPAADAPQLPENVHAAPLREPLNLAIGHMVGAAERAPKAFRSSSALDVLAVLSVAHGETYNAVVAILRGTGALPESKLAAAVNRFEVQVKRAVRTEGSWRTTDKGVPEPRNADNVATLLNHAKTEVRFNGWTLEIEYRRDEDEWRPFDDAELNYLRRIGSSDYEFYVAKSDLRDYTSSIARDKMVDPVLDKIESLVWDGTVRLSTWISRVCGVPDNAYHAAVGTCAIGGAVKRVRVPGCKHDFVPLFIGDQRKGKSTLCKIAALQEEWYSETVNIDARPENLVPMLTGKLVFELAEFDKLSRKQDVQEIKRFISQGTDRLTPKYEAFARDVKRRMTFWATANGECPLADLTGGTRFFPVRVGSNDVDLEWLGENIEQLYAEAAHMHNHGENFELPPSVYDAAAEAQENARGKPDFEVALHEWFAQEDTVHEAAAGRREFIHAAALQQLLRDKLRRSVASNDVAAVMKKLGFQNGDKKLNRKVAWLWWRGEWAPNGEGMTQYTLTADGRLTERTIPAKAPPLPV
jgi:predicted P-loop ATPase